MAYRELKPILKSVLEEDDHSWAEQARKRWKKDLQPIRHFMKMWKKKMKVMKLKKKRITRNNTNQKSIFHL